MCVSTNKWLNVCKITANNVLLMYKNRAFTTKQTLYLTIGINRYTKEIGSDRTLNFILFLVLIGYY